MNLKTVIVLSASSLDDVTARFFEECGVKVVFIENAVNDSLRGLYPVAEEMVTESLKIISDNSNYPILITCKTGKALTGVTVACLRKLQRWSLTSIFEEYRRYAGGSRLQQQHEQFIEIFGTELIPITENAPNFLMKT